MSHPIHIFKFCPRCGSNEFITSSERSLKCNHCGFHFYINSAASVACLIFNHEGKLLLTRRAIDPDKGKLDLPGGFIDPLETAEEAVKREIREELGVNVIEMKYLTSKANEYLFSGITVFTTDMAFRVKVDDVEKITANDDISSFEWLHPEDVDPEDVPAPSIRYFVKELAIYEK